MDKPIYKTMKIFDCQWNPGMPEDVKEAFFDIQSEWGRGNDTFVSWTIETKGVQDPTEDYGTKVKLVDQWLIDNGADAGSDERCGETVLIKYWW